ncbi:hypothetical protein FA95DRAFT_1520516 [Auriscalpium vulgare]|uniref:Uncharacterized protein n=1 Tax=Auriscalpium vulgare TaxID=40419 RepID=A0ACB8RPY1_9AGAM|nr:hypothetical protein FA95DRAFT_1520516 [Auriscalpium vulgare]
MITFNSILHQVTNTKIKERQEGLSKLRSLLSSDKAIRSVDISQDSDDEDVHIPSSWNIIYDALFVALSLEKDAFIKTSVKSTTGRATAERRLSEVASTVRWLTEKVVARLESDSVSAILRNLLSISIHNNALVSSIGLDLTKTIRCLLSYAPHLDHLEQTLWVRVTCRSFDVVLGDHFSTRFSDDSWDDYQGDLDATSAGGSDREEDTSDDAKLLASKRTKKRRRTDSRSRRTPLPSHRATPPTRLAPQPVSLEQIEYTALLATLLASPSAPILLPPKSLSTPKATSSSDAPNIPELEPPARAILIRLLRFIKLYRGETSLHQDYLTALSATLSKVALNRRDDVTRFSRAAWDGLVGMWGTRNKRIKESLVAILRTLFPYHTSQSPTVEDSAPDFDYVDGIFRLWHLLNGEAENRWGVDALSLDSLRLCSSSEDGEHRPGAFVARTFRYGWNFDAGQALAWAVLDLQADCAEKLFFRSEAVNPSRHLGRREGKRVKLENPISSLLTSIQRNASPTVRAYHLQILLFFIDRHWTILHESFQQDIMTTLLQFVAIDDGVVQSWTFLCFAAIAERQVGSDRPVPPALAGPATWDPIWTHAMRRSNVAVVSRTACHVASVLLRNMKSLLSFQRVLPEIETFVKDLDVQGPPFPYESVCAFMVHCLQIANQDMRLYRMRIDETMLAWLTDNWRFSGPDGGRAGGRSRAPHPLVSDLMALLEAICWLPKRSSLVCRIALPDAVVVEQVREERRTAVIRDFLLHARLPPFRRPKAPQADASPPSPTSSLRSDDLAKPGAKERKISTALLKSLDAAHEASPDAGIACNFEKARIVLNLAVMSVFFESALVYNGTQANRRVLQAAGKVITHTARLLVHQKWTSDEKAAVMLGFSPLIAADEEDQDESWEALPAPHSRSGIRKEVLKALTSSTVTQRKRILSCQRDLQRILWQNTDLHEVLSSVMAAFKEVLRSSLTRSVGRMQPHDAMDIDERDEFAPIRTVNVSSSAEEATSDACVSTSTASLVADCISFVALGPVLGTPSGEPTRDEELANIISAGGSQLLTAGPAFFANVRQGTLSLNLTSLEKIIDVLGDSLMEYSNRKSETWQLLGIQAVDAVLAMWLMPAPDEYDEVRADIGDLCKWLLTLSKAEIAPSWKVRHAVLAFMARYISLDPPEGALLSALPDNKKYHSLLPSKFLPTASKDQDIRVRFQVAKANASLFILLNKSTVYTNIQQELCTEWDKYEKMLTRFITLGCIMVVSSAVRRGPYWHLVEICYYTDQFSKHVESILRAVSERLGLTGPSELFEVYAGPIAPSILGAGVDFLRVHPSIYGYQDKKTCAKAAFHAFTPSNLLAGVNTGQVTHGKKAFENHCKVVGISTVEGYRRSFPDLVGYELTSWIDTFLDQSSETIPLELEEDLVTKTVWPQDAVTFHHQLVARVDDIVVAVLRTLGDQDCSPEGIIVQELRARDSNEAGLAFQSLTSYRYLEDHEPHEPLLPSFGSTSVMRALQWLTMQVPEVGDHPISYQVVHQLLADIHRMPLVNEQLRRMNALCVWIACHFRHFREPVLLHTLVHGMSSLLAQADLARAAQSVLDWAFSQYEQMKEKDSRLADVLIRISSTAHDYSRSSDPALAETGASISRWLDETLVRLNNKKAHRRQISDALPAWPRPPAAALQGVYQEVTYKHLSSNLADARITSNKFRLVRRLQDSAVKGEYSEEQFSRIDFWRLRRCIPPSHRLQVEDIDAFAALLLENRGQIHGFGLTPLSAQAAFQQKHDGFQPSTLRGSTPERSIMECLMLMLASDTPSRVHVAYRVLRAICSTQLPIIDTDIWPSEYVGELNYIRTRPYPAVTRPHPDITVLETSPIFVDMAKDFSIWAPGLSTLLSDILAVHDPFYGQLAAVLESDHDVAEQVLPILVHKVLKSTRNDDHGEPDVLRQTLSHYFMSVLSSPNSDMSSLRAVVNIVLHLRHFRPDKTRDELAYNSWLDIDYMLLSSSAIACGAYTTALLFHELAAERPGTEIRHGHDSERILYEIYSRIDEPDSFYGIQTNDLYQFLIKKFHHEQQWDKAFQFHGAAIEARGRDAQESEGLLRSLHSFGFDSLALTVQQNASDGISSAFGSKGMTYHLGWRTETWDLPTVASDATPGASLYQALRAIYRERDAHVIDATIEGALLEEMGRLRRLGDEDLVSIREVTQSIMSLSQIKSWRKHEAVSKSLDSAFWSNLSNIDSGFDFRTLEDIMATRLSLIRSVSQKEQTQQIGLMHTPLMNKLVELERNCLVRISEAARESGNLQVALNSAVRAQRLEKTPTTSVSQEFASVLWNHGEQKIAVQFLKEVVSRHSSPGDITEKAVLLARLGSWTSEAGLEKPIDVWRGYFYPAAALLEHLYASSADLAASAVVYHECAVFADRQYHAILQSHDNAILKHWKEVKEREVELRSQEVLRKGKGAVEKRDLDKAKAQLDEDTERYRAHQESLDTFLHQSIDMYARCLQLSDDFDDDGHIRLVSLWFANFDDESLGKRVRASIKSVPSRKFVFLAHQLSARLSKGSTSTGQETLQALVLSMCREHPFHSLYQVWCLRPSPAEPAASGADRRTSGRHNGSFSFSQSERSAAADEIFDRLRSGPTSEVTVDVERVCKAYLQWAKYKIKNLVNGRSGQRPIPEGQLKLLDVRVPVLTAPTPLDPSGKYLHCVWIQSYESTYETAGGVNVPKINVCRGSDGNKYKQLFKGEGDDDLRQDAVMEQVFDLVNVVLRRDRETRRRNLRIRGYKVVPLAAQAGVLEFVGNTAPLSKWLIAAHQRYKGEGSTTSDIIISEMKRIRAQTAAASLADKLVPRFREMREQFKPVMRHFFTEKHKMPMSWFAMRLNYTRSVATTSIVGHVLGLGDRHTSNILMDNVTGEAVHIDLGIAFEQGKLLPIPERVPFRMTTDMVDGMGTAGTQGVFQRCAEETLRVLREGSEIILTVLEVFKHDPLHSWTASELKFKRAQESEAVGAKRDASGLSAGGAHGIGAEAAADRALSAVTRKLDKSLSVEYAVNELIAEATDPSNLAMMYCGWSPHY